MAEKKYIDFIEKILLKTKENKIRWKYLDENDNLYQRMGWADGIIGEPNFNTEKSFFAEVNHFYIVLRTQMNNLSDLYVIPWTYKNICVLKADQYGEYITRLYNMVQTRFPDATVFINSFLNEP